VALSELAAIGFQATLLILQKVVQPGGEECPQTAKLPRVRAAVRSKSVAIARSQHVRGASMQMSNARSSKTPRQTREHHNPPQAKVSATPHLQLRQLTRCQMAYQSLVKDLYSSLRTKRVALESQGRNDAEHVFLAPDVIV